MKKRTILLPFFAWLFLYTLLHAPAFRVDIQSMHAYRQAMTQNNILNFAHEDFNIFNPRRDNRGATDGIFRMEFPVMQWLFGAVYRAAGSDRIIITRLLSLLTGVASVVGFFWLVYLLTKKKIIALAAAWFFSFSPTFYYFTVAPMPDNFALCCGIWATTVFLLSRQRKSTLLLFCAGLLYMLATAAKLPFVLYCALPGVYLLLTVRQNISGFVRDVALVFAPQILPLLWYAWVIPTWEGNPVVKGIFASESSLRVAADYFQHHLISTLPENLLNFGALLPFLVGIFIFFRQKYYRKRAVIPFLAWFAVLALYFLYELNVVGKSHDYYFLPFLPLIFLLVALGAKTLLNGNKTAKILLYICIAVVPLTAYLRMNSRWDMSQRSTLQIYKKEIQAVLPPDAPVVVGNDISAAIMHYYTGRKGWSFWEDKLTSEALEVYKNEGAEYLISTSRAAENKVKNQLGKEIFAKEEVRIFALTK